MTLFYKTQSWSSQPHLSEETKEIWKRYSKKKNWRITQLPNGYYQAEWNDTNDNWNGITRRETIEAAEKAIESSIEHYLKKLKLSEGPVVVKTFK
ncbi:MAG: hypothetical protein OR998_06120 [Flavobacteriaceae bacterium]|jgi:hypothetical protein|nr:hypothetical protein [Flavobacteriaceae bacterium]|tara:strand:+ start:123 stop:407 length:285 start_codon:yes stop_codon:yes gene_type:complete